MRRLAIVLLCVLSFVPMSLRAATAQEEITGYFAPEVLESLDFPTIDISVGEGGVVAPDELTEGWYTVSFSADEPYIGYLNFMIPPDGLDTETATQQALDAGANDLALPDWEYIGGVNTFELGKPVVFSLYLRPGEVQVAASYYPEGEEYTVESEVMTLKPLMVTPRDSDDASPEVTGAPEADVTLEMTDDLAYIVSPDPIPAGPLLWEITNTGTEHAHHVVMMKVPDGITKDDILTEFEGLMAGTPPAAESVMMSSQPAGYAALQSGGYTTYQGYDLEPGTYAVICYIINHHTGMPHFVDGMVTVFTVE
jgi:hypothetical protein